MSNSASGARPEAAAFGMPGCDQPPRGLLVLCWARGVAAGAGGLAAVRACDGFAPHAATGAAGGFAAATGSGVGSGALVAEVAAGG